jgi:hypothetical protein
MAYANHAYFVIQGKWANSDMANEVWQVGIRLTNGATPPGYLTSPPLFLTNVSAALSTWWTGDTKLRSDAWPTVVKCNNIGPDGKYIENVTHQIAFPGSPGGGTPTMPAFVMTAVTLETGVTLGRAKRGRIYLPTQFTLAGSSSASITGANATAMATKVHDLLALLKAAASGGSDVVTPTVLSKIDGSYHKITGVSTDYILDVQRRRKNRATHTRSAIVPFP